MAAPCDLILFMLGVGQASEPDAFASYAVRGSNTPGI